MNREEHELRRDACDETDMHVRCDTRPCLDHRPLEFLIAVLTSVRCMLSVTDLAVRSSVVTLGLREVTKWDMAISMPLCALWNMAPRLPVLVFR